MVFIYPTKPKVCKVFETEQRNIKKDAILNLCFTKIPERKGHTMNVMQQLLTMNVETLLKDFAAYRTFHKSDSVINMRIPHEVLDKIKAIADEQGVPYQSLISSVLFALTDADSDDKK